LDDLIDQLRNSPFVKETSRIILNDTRFNPPNDEAYSNDWDESNPFFSEKEFELEYSKFLFAWGLAYEFVAPDNATDIRVAVVDQGFNRNHEDLLSNINSTLSSAWLGLGDHGTKVTGVIGAEADNKIGIAGTLWNADLVLRHMMFNSTTHAVNEMIFSLKNGAKIINFSNGKTYPENPKPWIKLARSLDKTKYRDLLDYCDNQTGACASDVLFVFAVGNDGKNGTGISDDFVNDLPSSFSLLYPNVISVGAGIITGSFERSGQGGDIDVAAPAHVWTTRSGNPKYGYAIGTSYATPTVSGLAGLILTRNSNLTPSQVKNIIIAGSCITKDDTRKVSGENFYAINAYESLRLADNPGAVKNACDSVAPPPPEPFTVTIEFHFNPPFTGTPGVIRGGVQLLEQVTTIVYHQLYDGNTLLDTRNNGSYWTEGNGSGWHNISSDCAEWNTADFTSIRDGSINGRFVITSDVPFYFIAPRTAVDLTNCEGTKIVGRGTVTLISVNDNPVFSLLTQ